MKTHHSFISGLISRIISRGLLITGAILMAGIVGGMAAQSNPRVIPTKAHPHGHSYAEWSAAWWTWAYSIPADEYPITDTTGEFADRGQSGSVWFLAGNYGGTTVRDVTVPAGKALFFPLFNYSWVQFPTDPPYTIPELREIIAAFVDNPTLSCEVDGIPIKNLLDYRIQSVVFSVTLPPDNVLQLDPGTYAPCVDDGYYLMLAPLSAGKHTIHFTATSHDGSFSLDVTYHLTVE